MDGLIALGVFDSVVGPLLLGATVDAVCLLEFSAPERVNSRIDELCARYRDCSRADDHRCLRPLRLQLEEYFEGRRSNFDVPLRFAGTPFQEKVWTALQRIPYGRTCSYLDLAKDVGDAGATRAVGAANGANPIAIVIPCHRVINANGQLGGYSAGLWRKRVLLDLERGQRSLPL